MYLSYYLDTVICLIEAPGAIARSNLILWSKSLGSELSNAGFRLKIRLF